MRNEKNQTEEAFFKLSSPTGQSGDEKPLTSVKVEPGQKGYEKFSFQRKNGVLQPQQVEALLQFQMLCKPYEALEKLHLLLFNYLTNSTDDLEFSDMASLEELFRLFTNMWAAERGDFENVFDPDVWSE